MTSVQASQGNQESPRPVQRVEIRIEGCLNPDWAEWFEGMEIHVVPGGQCVIQGEVKDQAALYGLIAKLRDLGVKLLAISFEEITVR